MRNKKLVARTLAIFVGLMILMFIAAAFTGCDLSTEADKVNYNMSQEAAYFNCERRIVVYNAIKHEIILEVSGYMDISNNSHDELVVTCKVGEDQYKKNYIYLNDFVLYTVEDITGTHTDPWHYEMFYHTGMPIDIDINKEPMREDK